MPEDKFTAPWHILADNSLMYFVEVIRNLDPSNEYSKKDLASAAGISTNQVYRGDVDFTDRAVDLGLLEESEGNFFVNEESELLHRLTLLNAAVDRRLQEIESDGFGR